NLIREIYVEEAREYLEEQNPDRKVTRSALALICGMDGRAIKSFEENTDRQYAPSDVCSEAAILEMWNKDESFFDAASDKPADLLIHGPHGTFQRLVSRAAGRAVTPQTALERLLESGNVRLVDNETRVRLIDPWYMPVEASERTAIEAGSFAISRLGKSILHNTKRSSEVTPAWLQQDRWSTGIPRERLELVRADIRAVLQKHIEQVEGYMEHQEHKPYERTECSIGVGWYYWEDEQGSVDG
ncbi:MAG: hypothetical protein GVY32_02940, partial [Gammaproteobacteria bacterium]|nr:hypothetical protein [Gammaproteobacteria bacterium]